jgi:predicted nucleic acid-binding protein
VILVDTSVWIQHLRSGEPRLVEELEAGRVCVHPMVIGEIACGKIGNRAEVLELLGHLPAVTVATNAEALEFIERRALMGRGSGFVDVHLLASAALTEVPIWTRDKRLAEVAADCRLNSKARLRSDS